MQEELKRMLTETAYSAKGHFKTADWITLSLNAYLTVPIVTSLLQVFFSFPVFAENILSFLGFLFSFLALNSVLASNRDKANRSVECHIDLGNKYLEIYKQIRIQMLDANSVSVVVLREFQTRISELDRRTSTANISFVGRIWSKYRIKQEMDLID